MIPGRTVVTTDASLEAIKKKAVKDYKQSLLIAIETESECSDECAKSKGCDACFWKYIKEIIEEVDVKK